MARRRQRLTTEQMEARFDRAQEALDWMRSSLTPYRGVSEESVDNAFDALETAIDMGESLLREVKEWHAATARAITRGR